MLSPRTGLPVPDPDLLYARMAQHTKDCVACQGGQQCTEASDLLRAWFTADGEMAVIEADLDAQLRGAASGE